jgi:hypothetical protein
MRHKGIRHRGTKFKKTNSKTYLIPQGTQKKAQITMRAPLTRYIFCSDGSI